MPDRVHSCRRRPQLHQARTSILPPAPTLTAAEAVEARRELLVPGKGKGKGPSTAGKNKCGAVGANGEPGTCESRGAAGRVSMGVGLLPCSPGGAAAVGDPHSRGERGLCLAATPDKLLSVTAHRLLPPPLPAPACRRRLRRQLEQVQEVQQGPRWPWVLPCQQEGLHRLVS